MLVKNKLWLIWGTGQEPWTGPWAVSAAEGVAGGWGESWKWSFSARSPGQDVWAQEEMTPKREEMIPKREEITPKMEEIILKGMYSTALALTASSLQCGCVFIPLFCVTVLYQLQAQPAKGPSPLVALLWSCHLLFDAAPWTGSYMSKLFLTSAEECRCDDGFCFLQSSIFA